MSIDWKTICCCRKPDIIAVEYEWDDPAHYDGVSEYFCAACGTRVGRWTGGRLADDEIEPPWGVGPKARHKRALPFPHKADSD